MNSHSTLERRKPEDVRVEQHLTDDPMTALYRVVINVIDACNRACIFCPRADGKNYPNNAHNKMSIMAAQHLATELARVNFKGVYSITGWGEPLLNTEMCNIISIFKRINPDAKVELQTNGDCLSLTSVQRLYQSGLDRLVINLYDNVIQAQIYGELLSTFPTSFWTLQHKYDNSKSYGMILNNRAGSYDHFPLLQAPIEKPCYMPFYKMAVDWNLDTYFCDYDWAKRIPLGNLYNHTIRDVWMSEKMKQIRIALYKGDRNFTPCKFCDAEGVLYGKAQADIIMKSYK